MAKAKIDHDGMSFSIQEDIRPFDVFVANSKTMKRVDGNAKLAEEDSQVVSADDSVRGRILVKRQEYVSKSVSRYVQGGICRGGSSMCKE